MDKLQNNGVFSMTEPQMMKLKQILEERSWELKTGPYMFYKASHDKISLAAYESGKLVVQGANAPEFIEFTLEPLVLWENGVPEPEQVKDFSPHAGMDESGKGDFFGPLAVAAVFVPDAECAEKLLVAGVKDSKLIKSDRQILAVAAKIKELVGDRIGLVTIYPEAYNRLYKNMHNLNRLLAWGHARALENLLTAHPECPAALADKFADEHLIVNALQKAGRKIHLDQRTKAESDVAVGAASIIARAAFVTILKKLGDQHGVIFPKGAGTGVDEIAKKLAVSGGEELLSTVAKMHFRTAYKALGLPVPEKPEFHH